MSRVRGPVRVSAGGASLTNSGKQDYGTPADFLVAVRQYFGITVFDWDLAAHQDNHIVSRWLGPGSTEAEDSLTYDWDRLDGHLWLNPPFNDIAPWAKKCATTCGAPSSRRRTIYFLVPASVGANWFAESVFPYARVYALQGRLSFDGKAPYPKDCMLCVFTNVHRTNGFAVWDWRYTLKKMPNPPQPSSRPKSTPSVPRRSARTS